MGNPDQSAGRAPSAELFPDEPARVHVEHVAGPMGDPGHVSAWRAGLLRSCAWMFRPGAGSSPVQALQRLDPIVRPLGVVASVPKWAGGRLVVTVDVDVAPHDWPLWHSLPVLAASVPGDFNQLHAGPWPFSVPWVLQPEWVTTARPGTSSAALAIGPFPVGSDVSKHFATLRARAALAGITLGTMTETDGETFYLLSRWGRTQELPDLAAVARLLRRWSVPE